MQQKTNHKATISRTNMIYRVLHHYLCQFLEILCRLGEVPMHPGIARKAATP